MRAVYGIKNSDYQIIVEEEERANKGFYTAVLYKGDRVVLADKRPHKTAEIACRMTIDSYIKDGFQDYLKYNLLVDEFMGEPKSKRNYWKEYREKIRADELEKLKEVSTGEFCTGYYRKVLD